MDYFIKKENYKGKKPNRGPFIMGLHLLKESKYGQFRLFCFIMTSLWISLSVRNRCIVDLPYHLARYDNRIQVFFHSVSQVFLFLPPCTKDREFS